MDLKLRVSMEYPFPANTNAFLAEQWNEALNNIDDDDMDEQELVDVYTQCSNELSGNVKDQETLMIDAMRELYADIGGVTDAKDKIRQTWRVIQEASNLIRCYASLLDTDGRMFGVALLIESIGKEY